MSAPTEKKTCPKCPKDLGQTLCGGCNQWFCWDHLMEHGQELRRERDNLIPTLDDLQNNLASEANNDQQRSLMNRIDRWESQSIAKIKQIADDVRSQLRDLFSRTKGKVQHSLNNITEEFRKHQEKMTYNEIELRRWTSQLQELRDQLDRPAMVELVDDANEGSSTHIPFLHLRPIQQVKVPSHITDQTRWSPTGQTVAGGYGQGEALNQLHRPFGLDIDDDGTLLVIDINNHRTVRWKPNSTQGEIIAGGKGQGDQIEQLNHLVAVLIDRLNDCLFVSEEGSRRLTRRSLDRREQNGGEAKTIISTVVSAGLAMDDEGSLYVSDFEKHEVRRYGRGDGREGLIVAGGRGKGAALNQLNGPRNIFVDADHSVYVSDAMNHRVMKWVKDAKEGVIVAGGRSSGSSLGLLNDPSGVFVDRMGSVYVADGGNDRIVRWLNGAKKGEILVGGNGRGLKDNQLNVPRSIALDSQGNLYVVDRDNNRVQRFHLQ